MPRLIFVNRFFFPDHSATSQILSDLAFHLAATGRDVHVITSNVRYDDPQALLPEREIIHGVNVHRMATTRFGRKRLLGRYLDYLTFFVLLRSRLAELARPGDVIVAKTDPPLLSTVALSVALWKRAHLVNWLQDLYPEVAVELGVPYLKGPVASALRLMRNISLQRAVMNVAVGEKMAELVLHAAGKSSSLYVIPNWTNDEEVVPLSSVNNPLRNDWQLADKFVVGYSGNLGRAHEVQTIVDAAELLRSHPKLCFLFVGGGHAFEELATQVRLHGLEAMFQFRPYQDRSLLKYSLTVPDVHLLSLRPTLEGLIVPSKFYGIAAAGRAIIAIVSAKGELAPLIQQNKCGIIVQPGNATALAQAISNLSVNRETCEAMGARARGMLDEHFTRSKALRRWHKLLARFER